MTTTQLMMTEARALAETVRKFKPTAGDPMADDVIKPVLGSPTVGISNGGYARAVRVILIRMESVYRVFGDGADSTFRDLERVRGLVGRISA